MSFLPKEKAQITSTRTFGQADKFSAKTRSKTEFTARRAFGPANAFSVKTKSKTDSLPEELLDYQMGFLPE